MVDVHGRHITHADEFGRLGPAMPRDDAAGTVSQDRTDKAKFLDARGNLLDLLLSMGARVSCPRLELSGVFIGDLQRGERPARIIGAEQRLMRPLHLVRRGPFLLIGVLQLSSFAVSCLI